MRGLVYFDTEDFVSPPNAPSHTIPAKFAEIMRGHGLRGCFHVHGERARFWERHGMADVIEAVKWHDVSLHFDRGSIHPTTAEEVSELDWFRGVERVMFRELPGFQSLERIFGKCSSLTQHGGTLAAQIVFAAGRLGKPFFHSPFSLPGRDVVWFCNNLMIGGHSAPFRFDKRYHDTAGFEAELAKVGPYLDERSETFDFTAISGCHPVMAVMDEFPDSLNFSNGATPAPKDWVAPAFIRGVSIPLVLENFERLIAALVRQPGVEWSTVADIHKLYGRRPVSVADGIVLAGAEKVVENGGPTFTSTLSAGELLFLLATRILCPAENYDVPQVMGPTGTADRALAGDAAGVDVKLLAKEVVDAVMASGYLPPSLNAGGGVFPLELACLLFACHTAGKEVPPNARRRLSIEAIPGAEAAVDEVRRFKWRIHGERYHLDNILTHFRLQCWTLKPAFEPHEYGRGVELGWHLNPMFERRTTE